MKKVLIVAAASLVIGGCADGAAESGGEPQVATDTLTRRQKDSILSKIPFPGAGGIGDAQKAADRLNARTLAHDTIS